MKSLFVLLLLTGSAPFVLSVSSKYYLIQEGRNWSDARAYCRTTYTDLTVIKNSEDMVQVKSESQKHQLSSSAWIGLYNDIDSWRWSFGNEPLGNMRKWAGSEPNNAGGKQECAVIIKSGWSDRAYTDHYSFICFDDSKTGTERYIFIPDKVTRTEAQRYCRQHHTDLASTRNLTEYTTVYKLAVNETWIGLFRDSWKWIDKTNFSTSSWLPIKVNNKLWNENCGHLNNSQVEDAPCSDIMPFFCYLGVTSKKQMLKVKIQSDKDVNDPAVKAEILEKIKQKVQDQGLGGNITVKWREQPDGLVFQKVNKEKEQKCDLLI